MMFNRILKFSQNKFSFLYNNSLILKNLDTLILPLILLVYVASTFLQSDYIGLIAFIIILLTTIKLFVTPNQKFVLSISELILLIYFLIIVISLFGSSLFYLSLKGFIKTFIYIGFYFSISQYIKTNNKKIPILLASIAFCIIIESIFGIFQSTLHLEQISTWQDTSRLNPEDVLSRVYGTLKPLNPNLYGGYLVSGLPLVSSFIFYFIAKKYYKLACFSGIFSLCVIYAILQTGCRGAYIAMLFEIFAVFLISAKFFWVKFKKLYTFIISVTTVLFTMMLFFVKSLRLRFISIFAMRSDSSNSFRFNVYNSSLEMFKDNWLLGIGVGNKNFREIYGLYMKTGFDALSTYNIYLETAVESGIFALLSFLVYLFVISQKALGLIFKTKNSTEIIFISGCIISIWGVMIHGLVDTVYFRPQIQFIFWTLTAIIANISSQNIMNKYNDK